MGDTKTSNRRLPSITAVKPDYKVGNIQLGFSESEPTECLITAIYGIPKCPLIISMKNYDRYPFYSNLSYIDIPLDTESEIFLDYVLPIHEWAKFHVEKRQETTTTLEECTFWFDWDSPLKLTRIEIRHDLGHPLALYPFFERDIFDTKPSIIDNMISLYKYVNKEIEDLIKRDRLEDNS